MGESEVWSRLEAAFRAGEPVRGTVEQEVGGFLAVDLGGIRAGLPLSYVDFRAPPDGRALIGRVLELEIVTIDRARGNVIVSRRALLEKRRARRLASLREGDVVEATVTGLDDIGAMVDLGDRVTARLHRTELELVGGKLADPAQVLREGQVLRVRVIALGTHVQVSARDVPG